MVRTRKVEGSSMTQTTANYLVGRYGGGGFMVPEQFPSRMGQPQRKGLRFSVMKSVGAGRRRRYRKRR